MKLHIFKFLMPLVFGLILTSCELFNLDINTNPNNPTQASLNLLLTDVQYTASNFLAGGVNNNLHGFVGILASGDNFDLNNGSYNFLWQSMYIRPLKDLDAIIRATEGKNNPRYLGIAQVMKAYYFSTMVDLFGDVPYSEAFTGDIAGGTKNPKFDSGAEIYADCFKLLDSAVVNLNRPSPAAVVGDVIYGGSNTKWIKAANSMRLKMRLQTRRVDPQAAANIQAAINAPGGLITDAADDFQFQFSSLVNPDNRHPWYQAAYINGNGFTYILHQYMVEMLENDDPRTPFYFRRQTEKILNQEDPSERNTTPCSQVEGCVYNYLVLNPNIINRLYTSKGRSFGDAERKYLAGFFGRDRSDPSGVPLDGDFRTTVGVYPAAGFYDITKAELPGANKAKGNGIFPIITSVNVLYYQIEAILALGAAGNARTLFEQAIRTHIDKVVKFGVAADANSVIPTTAVIDAYVNAQLARYDAAVTNENKLNVVIKQLWYSSWGNGYEIYNAFRRTGYPNNLQEPLLRIRQFALRLPYPSDELTLNPNAPANDAVIFDRDPVFWDNLKFQF
jgi:hypothetical protein